MTNLKREACLIGGEWIGGEQWIDVEDPATGEIIGRVPRLGRVQTEQAIQAAARAMGAWAQQTALARARILRRYYELIMAHQDALAALLTQEQGKPLAEARGEIAYAAAFIDWFAEEGRRSYGDTIPSHAPDKRIVVLKQPIGVVAAITPWNFPAAMITRKIGPALAAGCGVVVKPATQTPFTALALGVLAQEAGLPPGLLNIVTGSAADIGAALTESELVRKLSFTGSTEVGARLYAQCAPTIKKLSLELGGNAPFIVFDDADVDAAVAGALQSKFRNAGQTCVCANRLYAQAGIHDVFVERLAAASRNLKVGAGSEDGVDIGPLIDDQAVAKVRQHIADATAKGARDVGGNDYLDIVPAVWLGPLSLGSKAREINAAEYNDDTNKQQRKPNVVRGLFADVVDTPRLSGTAWYMFADPALEPVIEVAFLNGVQTPTMEQEMNFRTDGVSWKVVHRYGVAAIGWRGAVRNAGV